MQQLSPADLIINSDGSIYHLNLLPEDVAPTVITVGDPDRVSAVSKHFDSIEVQKGKREFITHTGYIGKKRMTVISTGIGTDNIDIVLNELDALVNIDFATRTVREKLKRLRIVRVGTSGAIQEDIPMGTLLVSTYGLGFDSLMNFYISGSSVKEERLLSEIKAHLKHLDGLQPYLTAADPELLEIFGTKMVQGITATAPGFYAPQGRQVRAKTAVPDLIQQLNRFQAHHLRITNLEMETAGIYALANALGHQALSVNAILASRVKQVFSTEPDKIVEKAIIQVLETFADQDTV